MAISKLKAIFIDFDGTLVDSLPLLYQTYLNFLKEEGFSGNVEEFSQLKGPSLQNIVEILRKKYDLKESLSNLYGRYESALLQGYQKVEPIQGAKNFLEWAKQNQLLLALVSSAPKKLIETFFLKFPKLNCFDLIITADTVKKTKPNPEIYLRALDFFKLKPKEALAIEDSPAGFESAKGAGIPVWLISEESTMKDPTFKNWDELLSFLKENHGRI